MLNKVSQINLAKILAEKFNEDFRKNSARRRPVTGRSPRTGEEAQCICSYSEQVRPEALISGCVCCFPGMIYPHIRRLDPVNRSMNDQQRIH